MSESFKDYTKRTWMLWAALLSALWGGEHHGWIAYSFCFAAGAFAQTLSKRITK